MNSFSFRNKEVDDLQVHNQNTNTNTNNSNNNNNNSNNNNNNPPIQNYNSV